MTLPKDLSTKTPTVGKQAVAYSWPRSVNYEDRPGELAPSEARDLIDFLSFPDGLKVRHGFTQLGNDLDDGAAAALDNIPIRIAQYEKENLDKFTMAHTETELYYLDGVVWTVIGRAAGYTGGSSDFYDSTVCLDDYVFTNYIDKLQYWDGAAGTALDVPATGIGKSLEFVRAKYCTYFAGRLFLANLVEAGPVTRALRVRWSEELLYRLDANWTNLGSGFNDLAETPDEIKGIAKLGSMLVVYKERSIILGFETGNINNPFQWSWLRTAGLDKGQGLVAHQSIAELAGFHLALFNDNVYRFDGARAIPIGDKVIREVVETAGVPNLSKAFCVVEPGESWYVLFVPQAGETWPSQGYVYDYRRDLWVGKLKRKVSTAGLNVPTASTTWAMTDPQLWQDVDESWGSFGLELGLPAITVGNPDDNKVYQYDSSAGYDGTGAGWITRDDAFEAPDHEKTLTRVKLRVDTGGVAQQLTLAVSLNTGRSYVQTVQKMSAAVTGEQDIFFDTRRTGVRFTLLIISTVPVTILEWTPSFQIRGRTK